MPKLVTANGLGPSVFFLKTKPTSLQKVWQSVNKRPNVSMVEPVMGPYDLAVILDGKTLADLRDFQEEMTGIPEITRIAAYPGFESWKGATDGAEYHAWTLIRSNAPGKVAQFLQGKPHVNNVIAAVGDVDILARIGGKSLDDLFTSVVRELQTVPGIVATETRPAAGSDNHLI